MWAEHVKTMQERGLRVEGFSGDRVVPGIRASADPNDAGRCDLVILATKASGVGPAAESIRGIIDTDSVVLTIQNGLGAGERIAKYLPSEQVLLGVAGGFGASMKGAHSILIPLAVYGCCPEPLLAM